MEELEKLLAQRSTDLDEWQIGFIPKHYKRLTILPEEAREIALYGLLAVGGVFPEDNYFFTQSLISGAILQRKYKTIIICTPSQYGKLIADNVPVLTSDGWKTHGSLRVGDRVIAPNGKFVTVTHVHPKQMTDRIVRFSNGDEIECHHNHEWVVYDRRLHREQVLETGYMEEHMGSGRTHFQIPQKGMLIGEEKALSVPPYVMGAWLGDGSTTKGQICSAPSDIAVLDKCREYYKNGAEWVHKTTGVVTRSYIGLSGDLTQYGLCFQRKDTRKKYIPEEYLTASMEQRLDLLAGLLDTDGYLYKPEGRYYFTTADETLKDDFETLVSTFGWRVSTVEEKPKMSSGGIEGKKPYWRTGFSPTIPIPCVLERKRSNRFAKQRKLGIESIRPCKPHFGNCITVDGGVYCVGRHLIPTHNSFILGRTALVKALEGHNTIITAPDKYKTGIIMGHMFQALQHTHEEIESKISPVEMTDIKRLGRTVSKHKLSVGENYIEAVSLKDTLSDALQTDIIGRGEDFFVDEADLSRSESFAEMGRRDFAGIDGERKLLVMISNPHRGGYFYEKLTEENPPDDTLIIWADALTAVEEGEFTAEQVLNSDFAKNASTRTRYLMCELDQTGYSMFPLPIIGDKPEGKEIHVLGIDGAYKGKDNIELCDLSVVITNTGNKLYVNEIATIDKSNWIDGVTSKRIISDVSSVYHYKNAPIICVDIGESIWLYEGLIQNNCNARAIHFGEAPTKSRKAKSHYAAVNAANKRAEMYLDLQSLMEAGDITFSEEAYEGVETAIRVTAGKYNPSGKLQIEDKSIIRKELKHSPDKLDALVLAIHAAVLLTE